MPAHTRPLIVRLRNWVGDVTLGLPTLQRLADAGFDLQLVGKGWARDLLAGHGWPVSVLPASFAGRVALLRTLARTARSSDDGDDSDAGFDQRLNAVCLPYSFSSALEFRAAGLRAIGHAHEGRGLLLARSVRRPAGLHELQVYWDLGSALLGDVTEAPAAITLRTTVAQRKRAAALRSAHGVAAGYVVVCPFAGGTFLGQQKTWPGFAGFIRQRLPALGRQVLAFPGPGEGDSARAQFGGAVIVIDGVDLGVYAAMLQDAALMIANDTGPGHIAAAVGTPLLSVLGPTDAAQWGAWGPSVQTLQHWPRWPSADEAMAAATRLLLAAPAVNVGSRRPVADGPGAAAANDPSTRGRPAC